ncbi:hypothetical protein LSPH26S_02212 [Lysinibacillus sphaericus]
MTAGLDALVRRREGRPHEPLPGLAVEVTGSHQDALVRQVGHGLPAPGSSRVTHRYRLASLCSTRKPCASRAARSAARRAAYRSRCSATCASSPSAATVAACTGAAVIMPPCLRIEQQLAEDRRVARDERGAVAGQVGALGEGVDGDDPLVRTPADVRVQDGDRLGLPAQLQVDTASEKTRTPCSRAQATIRVSSSLPRTLPVGLDGRVQPEQLQTRRVELRRVVVDDRWRRRAARRPRTSGRPGGGTPPCPRRRDPAASAARRRAPWSRPPAARSRGRSPTAPRRRSHQSVSASRPAPSAPTPWDSPASPPPRPGRPGSARGPGRRACRPRGPRFRPGAPGPSSCTAPGFLPGRRAGAKRLRSRVGSHFLVRTGKRLGPVQRPTPYRTGTDVDSACSAAAGRR